MSTTVTYKGSTLTTVENATKKLTTAGTWLEDDITIQDTSSGGGSVVVVDTPDSHGGTIREITAQNTVMLQGQKTVTLTTSPQTITPDTGYDGFASVIVDAGQIGMVTQDQDGYLVLPPNGDSFPRLLNHMEYTVIADATTSNKQTISIGGVSSGLYVVMMLAKERPATPSSGYTAYNWIRFALGGSASDYFGSIIRSDGTIGTDKNMASYTPTTGNLVIGGEYGTFRTGQIFDIYLFGL